MGDLNAEPGSADERTWPSDRPDRRIDYIWLSGDLAASRFVATTSTASDHRGIAVTVRPA
jgi:endonuclease/exonuclease/phosphatase family metal-dependent hydrolase